MWPLDFLLPAAETRLLTVTAGEFDVTLVQKPDIDFYESFFEIRGADGKTTRVMIHPDDRKWWRPAIVKQGTRIYFVRGYEGVGPKTSSLDTSDSTLFSGVLGDTLHLTDLDFSEPWNN